jgi:hypothetical protein
MKDKETRKGHQQIGIKQTKREEQKRKKRKDKQKKSRSWVLLRRSRDRKN